MDKGILYPVEPSPIQKGDIKNFRDAAHQFIEVLHTYTNRGRYHSLAVTKLEECVMFAVKSITHDEPKK